MEERISQSLSWPKHPPIGYLVSLVCSVGSVATARGVVDYDVLALGGGFVSTTYLRSAWVSCHYRFLRSTK